MVDLTFCQVMNLYNEKLDEILGDPLLSSISQHVTHEEVFLNLCFILETFWYSCVRCEFYRDKHANGCCIFM